MTHFEQAQKLYFEKEIIIMIKYRYKIQFQYSFWYTILVIRQQRRKEKCLFLEKKKILILLRKRPWDIISLRIRWSSSLILFSVVKDAIITLKHNVNPKL